MYVICRTCGNSVQTSNKNRKYCNRICYWKTRPQEMTGPNHHRWKGGSRDKQGRLMLWDNGKKKYDYTIKVEKILGKELPLNAVIHHVDGDNTNNVNTNLVVCENQEYHLLLHTLQGDYGRDEKGRFTKWHA